MCQDMNECQTGLHDCDYNAQCINEIGSYSCRCNPGYEGDGRFCENAQTCQNVQCPENAECVENGIAICQCIAGFTGNGQICTPIVSKSCHTANNCSPYGFCTINPQNNLYSCVCLPGYVGDGYNCQRELIETTTEIVTEEPVTVSCLFGICYCPAGYERQADTNYCTLIEESTTTSVDVTTSEIDTETEPRKFNKALYYNGN